MGQKKDPEIGCAVEKKKAYFQTYCLTHFVNFPEKPTLELLWVTCFLGGFLVLWLTQAVTSQKRLKNCLSEGLQSVPAHAPAS